MRFAPLACLLGACAPAQADEGAAVRAAMEVSIARQRSAVSSQAAAVARQSEAARAMASAAATQQAAVQAQVRPPEFPALANPQASCGRLPAAEVNLLVDAAARREGLPPALLQAVVRHESGFRPCAVSEKGALGLMQLMPSTAWELGVTDAFDPAENVDSGARLLGRLLSRYGGDVRLALGAYNAGPARVDAAGGVPAIPETEAYVHSILESLGGPGSLDMAAGSDSR